MSRLTVKKRLIMNGKTTLEFCEKKQDKTYDKGIYNNFKLALGDKFYLWIFPCGNCVLIATLLKFCELFFRREYGDWIRN